MTRPPLTLTAFATFAAGMVILTGAYCVALASIDAERAPPAATCGTDSECMATPECSADPQCDGGPY
jgi:hypothetical protein